MYDVHLKNKKLLLNKCIKTMGNLPLNYFFLIDIFGKIKQFQMRYDEFIEHNLNFVPTKNHTCNRKS